MKKGGPKRSVELMGIAVVLLLPVGFSLGWRWLGLVLESEISMSELDDLVIVVLLDSTSSLGQLSNSAGCMVFSVSESLDVTTHRLQHYEYLIHWTGMLTFTSYSLFYG